MTTTIEYIKQLREATGAGILECRQVLENNDYMIKPALAELQEIMTCKAVKNSMKETPAGTIEVYTHNDGRVGVMLEVNCETDFAARSVIFRTFVHELALHIAAESPRWVADGNVPAEILEQEKEKVISRVRDEGKSETLFPRICEGAIHKFLDKNVLLRQASIRDETITVEQLLAQAAVATGENIIIRRFVRWELAEGVEPKNQ